ncbi:MAG: hypothetical protein ACE14V_15540 [bacterium]
MTEFKRNLVDEIIWMVFFLTVIFFFPGFREYRILWLIFWFIVCAGVFKIHSKYRIQLDDQGLTIRYFRKPSTVIPWTSIRHLLFYRIPILNLPVFKLRVEKEGKLLTVTVPNHIVNYLQLVQSIIDHTQLQPPSRWNKFRDRNTSETLSTRIRYSAYYLIIFLLVFWGYTDAFTSILWDPPMLFLLAIGWLVSLKQCYLLRYRNPQKTSILTIVSIIFYIIGAYTLGSMFIGNANRYYLLLPLLLTFFVILLIIAAVKKISGKSIAISILAGLIIFIGIYYGSQKVLSRLTIPHTRIATVTGAVNDISWSPDGTKLIMEASELDMNQTETPSKVWEYLISVPGYTVTSTKVEEGMTRFGWSPDSNHILMPILSSNTQNKFTELRVYNATLNSFQVIDHQTTINFALYVNYSRSEQSWSPDGKFLVYQSPVPSQQKKGRKLILYNVATQQKDTLISLDSFLTEAFWTNPTTIRYLTYEQASSEQVEKYYTIWDIDINKREPKKVFHAPESWRTYRIVANNRYIALFQLGSGTGMPDALYAMDSFQQIELPKLETEHYTFHPLGDRILYVQSSADFDDRLIEYNLKTKSSRTIPTTEGKITDCCYSPSGKYIIYFCVPGFGSAVFAVTSDGLQEYKITDQNMVSSIFAGIVGRYWAWSPNGDQLVFPMLNLSIPVKSDIYLCTFK